MHTANVTPSSFATLGESDWYEPSGGGCIDGVPRISSRREENASHPPDCDGAAMTQVPGALLACDCEDAGGCYSRPGSDPAIPAAGVSSTSSFLPPARPSEQRNRAPTQTLLLRGLVHWLQRQRPRGGWQACEQATAIGTRMDSRGGVAPLAAWVHRLVHLLKQALRQKGSPVVLVVNAGRPAAAAASVAHDDCASATAGFECVFNATNISACNHAMRRAGPSAAFAHAVQPTAESWAMWAEGADDAWVPPLGSKKERLPSLGTLHFISILTSFAFQVRRDVRQRMATRLSALRDFSTTATPFLGVEVHRTPPAGNLSGYLRAIERLAQLRSLRTVYVASSDDARAAERLRRTLLARWPSLHVAIQPAASVAIGEAAQTSTLVASAERALTDLHVLASATALVGSFASRTFRVAFELAYARRHRVVPFETVDGTAWCWACG